MYSIGDRVVYSIHGICSVNHIEQRKVDKKMVSYYVLVPLGNDKTQYYVPVHNEAALAKMRPLVTKEYVTELLQQGSVFADCWIPEENLRKLKYKQITGSVDFEATLQMVCTLHRHRLQQLESGRKFHMCDENFLRDAQRLVESELSVVLDIPVTEVFPFLQQYCEQ